MRLARACPRLRDLRLKGLANVDDTTLRVLAECCPQLATLDVSGARCTDGSQPSLSQGGLCEHGSGECDSNGAQTPSSAWVSPATPRRGSTKEWSSPLTREASCVQVSQRGGEMSRGGSCVTTTI